ncbi:MAG: AMP-dependent synthetase/ligase, partial [Aeromicrobium sp.]
IHADGSLPYVTNLGNLTDDVLDRLALNSDAVAFARTSGSAWNDVTIGEFHEQMIGVAKGLIAAGVNAGDRVALLSKTRYEWTLLDFAILWIGATTVPIYETSSADQIGWILENSGAVAGIVENAGHIEKVHKVRARAPELRHLWSINAGAVEEISTLGVGVEDTDVETRRAAITSDTIATLVYTSGTTGRPKGCKLTHGNFRYELGEAIAALPELFGEEDASTLLFLPLAHVFARVIQFGAVRSGAKLGHTADVKDLVTHLGEFHPTFILAVPRVFEKVFNSASQKAWADGKGKIFDRAVATGIAFSKAEEAGGAGLILRAKHAAFDKIVYAKLRQVLGGHAAYAISGGAPLGDRLAHFYRGIGVPVLEGYGLTETTAALCVNTPTESRVGTVGRLLGTTEGRVAADGELQFRGGQVFSGYWENDDATKQVLDTDGWFATGDIGEIDSDGFIRITGRKKEILVTAGGKNVAPAVLEDRVRAHPFISQSLVVGDGKPFIAALVTIDREAYDGDLNSPDLRAEVQKAIDDANTLVSKAESIRKFQILPADWTEENGYLTPSFKVKRNLIVRDFHDVIEALFSAR